MTDVDLTPAIEAARTALGEWIEPQYGDLISPLNANRVLSVIVEAAAPVLLAEAATLQRVIADQKDRLIAQAKRIEDLETAENVVIDDAIRNEEWADKLAAATATHFGIDIGEHSNDNSPWANALEAFGKATDGAFAGSPQVREWLAKTVPSTGEGKTDDPAEIKRRIAKLREHLGELVHPEEFCHRCGGPNVSWRAPSPLWNQVMRGGCINGPTQFNDLICPTCFAVLAEAAGIADIWRFHPERINVPLQLVTPSGRTWNDQTWLWDDTPLPPIDATQVREHPGTGVPMTPVAHPADGTLSPELSGVDGTCGDCTEGQCHGADPDDCGCDRHDASYIKSDRCCGDHEPTCSITAPGAECCNDCPDKTAPGSERDGAAA